MCGHIFFQVTKSDFEKYSRDSEIFKALDKNKDGKVSARELTSKAEMAFKVEIFYLNTIEQLFQFFEQ